MLKKILIALCLIITAGKASAIHINGGEIRYEYNGTNYTVKLRVYINCHNLSVMSQTMTFVSGSCNDSFQRVFAISSIDTVKDAWCSSNPVSCSTPQTPVIIYNYTDTVSLDQCPDWRIYTVLTALSNAIDNAGPGPGGLSLYLIAKLNNSNSINSSPYIANHPPFQPDGNSIDTIPLQVIDPDGDSVVFEFREIPTGLNTTSPFAPTTGPNPYSVGHQMGNFTLLDNVNRKLIINPNVTSENIMAIGIKEYRNGLQIGDYTRIWTSAVQPHTNYISPMAVPGSIYSYYTLWGQVNDITLNFTSTVATDSVFVDFFPPNLNGFTFTTNVSNGIGSASGTISWITPSGISEAELPYFIIPVRARNNSCPDQSYAYYGILEDMQQAWPLSIQDISASNAGMSNRIDWKVDDTKQIQIERSEDAKNFLYLSDVSNKNIYWDNQPLPGVNYYRLMLTSYSGKVSYSKVVSAYANEINAPVDIKVYPNPANSKIKVQLTGTISGVTQLTLTDITGKAMMTFNTIQEKMEIDIKEVPVGIYFIKYSDEKENKIIKLIKQQ